MTITRDVVLDLLPAYFAGDVSADTRTLIDEFFATDPDFRAMAEKFRHAYHGRGSDAARVPEVRGFEQARKRLEHRHIYGAFALAYGLAALFPGVVEFFRIQALTRRSWTFAGVFGTIAVVSLVQWLRTKPDLSDGSTRRLFGLAVCWAFALTVLAVMSYVAL